MAEKATYIAGTWQQQKYIWFGKYKRKEAQIFILRLPRNG
jgi:hypothetical protein